MVLPTLGDVAEHQRELLPPGDTPCPHRGWERMGYGDTELTGTKYPGTIKTCPRLIAKPRGMLIKSICLIAPSHPTRPQSQTNNAFYCCGGTRPPGEAALPGAGMAAGWTGMLRTKGQTAARGKLPHVLCVRREQEGSRFSCSKSNL